MKINEVNKKIKQLVGEGDHKYLLTVSGGADSIAMLDVFASLNLDFIVAHCNFNLRDKESDRDEAHVRDMCASYGVPVFVKSFATQEYADKHSLSIEMAARDLRYSWFHSLRKENSCGYIVVAHHMGDVAETIFINMLRGTGLRGLSGIAEKAGRVIRPFLTWGREDILVYLNSKSIKYCNDSTNDTNDYTRNKIRHNIIPCFQEMNPSFLRTMLENSQRMAEAEILYLAKIQDIRLQICSYTQNEVSIDIEALKDCLAPSTVLYEILKDYHFTGKIINDVIKTLDGLSGKYFVSNSHKLVKDRDQLIIYPLTHEQSSSCELVESIKEPIELNLEYFENSNYEIIRDRNIACFDADLLKMPLILRKWKEGDIFHPFGMKGKKKKVSDYFSDNKFSIKDKEDCWLLESDGDIIWIVSHRTDERFKLSKNTKRVLQIFTK
jgi:tRNA(Ile)-lysidine synthase